MTEKQTITILYKNWKGEIGYRRILPQGIRFASSEFHPEEQWLLDAFDLDKQAQRAFAVRDILEWKQELRSHRLMAQDIDLSRRRSGFDSPWDRCSARMAELADASHLKRDADQACGFDSRFGHSDL